jgi:hypothetical protein
LVVAAGVLSGCVGGPKASFDSRDPQERALAVVEASAAPELDDDSLGELIEALDSVDPAERLLSIRTLQHQTGETFGYRHFDPEWKREEAIARWEEWWSRHSQGLADTSVGDNG